MAIRIIKGSNKKRPIYFRHCYQCGCEFEFEKEDVKEEIYKGRCGSADTHFMDAYYYKGDIQPYCTPHEAFAALIDKVSGKGAWESNPFVFVYEFELAD